jgi:hypothetical protein
LTGRRHFGAAAHSSGLGGYTMALTSQQKMLIRNYMGYSVSGDSTYYPLRELAYSDVSYMGIALDTADGQGRLNHLSSDEESRITGYFLPNLTARETEIQGASSLLGTAAAAVWTRNVNEIAERKSLFADLRRELCVFLGFPPGPSLGGGNRLSRC